MRSTWRDLKHVEMIDENRIYFIDAFGREYKFDRCEVDEIFVEA